MSLLDEFKESFSILEKQRIADDVGGYEVIWSEGATIDLVPRFDQSMTARTAEKQGVTSLYTFLAPKGAALDFHDVIRRKKDGQVYRITSHANESITPASSHLDLTTFTAERWELT